MRHLESRGGHFPPSPPRRPPQSRLGAFGGFGAGAAGDVAASRDALSPSIRRFFRNGENKSEKVGGCANTRGLRYLCRNGAPTFVLWLLGDFHLLAQPEGELMLHVESNIMLSSRGCRRGSRTSSGCRPNQRTLSAAHQTAQQGSSTRPTSNPAHVSFFVRGSFRSNFRSADRHLSSSRINGAEFQLEKSGMFQSPGVFGGDHPTRNLGTSRCYRLSSDPQGRIEHGLKAVARLCAGARDRRL